METQPLKNPAYEDGDVDELGTLCSFVKIA